MANFKNVNFKVTPSESRIIICYQTEYDTTIVLTPNYNSVYEFADMNGHLSWIENDLKNGEFVSTYHSITFQELLDDDEMSDRLFSDYINKKCKNNSAYKLVENN